jgi:diguanylate cyclase (GGDEF)-like protein/PAS domain S-box-containing protein
MSSPSERATIGPASLPRARRMDVIVWLFAGIVVCLLAASLYSLSLLSGGRAYVGAEGLWSRAQNDAIAHLTRYALRQQDADFAAFERAMAVPLGMREARLELEKAKPDYEVARAGFLQGRNHPGDVDAMMTLYERFRPVGFADQAVALWRRADERLEELRGIALDLRASGPLSDSQRAAFLDRIERVGASLRLLEDAVAATLAEAQRAAQALLLAGLFVLSALMLVAGIVIAKRFVSHNDRFQRALRRSEAQMRNLIDSAPLPLLIVRSADQRLLYANERGMQQFGLDADSVRNRPLSDLQADPQQYEMLAKLIAANGAVRDFEIRMHDRDKRDFWQLVSAQPIRFQGEDCLLAALANIDERKRVQEDMRRRAMHDQLTGLPNRAMFMESLEHAVRKGRRRHTRFSVLFVDLDKFKEVNDTMGHHAGDELLKSVSERLQAAVRQSDLVARLGGDEFVVLIEEHGGPEEVMIVAQKIMDMLVRPVLIDWREVAVSGSIGIASFPEDADDVASLMKNADAAMYQAKERGRNNFQFYSEDLNAMSQERLEREKRVRGALERDEFFLQYQAEHDITTGRVIGVEALVRWRDPVAGVVAPEDFLPLAEEAGAVRAIGKWVLDRGLADLQAWHDLGHDLQLAVNVSPGQLREPELVNDVFQALQAHGIAPDRLRLEITESALMADSEAADATLRRLMALGVKLALDDFGTGYSSLGLVRGLPLHAVKIDKSLVSACPTKRECAAIVQATSAMAKALGITLIAEGVETEEQREVMRSLGCASAQGYLYGKPSDWAGVLPQQARATVGR